MARGELLFPPDIVTVEGPVVFLAGPIQGAPPWQAAATEIIAGVDSALNIANPRREYLPGEFIYAQQVDWETHFLNLAAKSGVILFWLAKEIEEVPGRAYAQTSRFELAEWKVKHERDGINLVVGIEEGFTNARYIRHRFSQDCSNVPILNDLRATCAAAVELIEN